MKDASVALYTYFSNQRQCEFMKLFDLPKVQGQECEHAHSSSQRETRDFRPLEVKRFVEKLFLILSYLTKSNLVDSDSTGSSPQFLPRRPLQSLNI